VVGDGKTKAKMKNKSEKEKKEHGENICANITVH
jgi:hypothetical protein